MESELTPDDMSAHHASSAARVRALLRAHCPAFRLARQKKIGRAFRPMEHVDATLRPLYSADEQAHVRSAHEMPVTHKSFSQHRSPPAP